MIYEEIKHTLIGIAMEGIRSIVNDNKLPTTAAYNKINYITQATEDILNEVYKLENKEQK